MEHLKLSLLISSFIIPLILSMTIFVSSKNNLPKQVMAFALLNAFFVFLANYFYFQKLFSTYSLIHSLHIATVLWLFPSIYLYIKSIISDNFKKDLLHMLPGLIFGCTSAILFYGLLNHDERVFYLSNYRTGTEFTNIKLKIISIFRIIDVFLIIAQVIYYSILFIRLPGKYHERLEQEYSNIENFSISWIKSFNAAFVLVGLLSILFYVFNPFQEKNELFLIIFLFAISVFIWIIGIWSFKQKKPQLNLQLSISTPQPSNNLKSHEQDLAKALTHYFETEKPFLQPDLNLTTVCKNIGTNRSYLSGVINSKFGLNFNAFVNQYRIQYLQEYLQKYPETTKENMAQVSGFGSVSSLKRALNNPEISQSQPKITQPIS